MAFPLQSSGITQEVDFNFPKTVSSNALSDLNQALKTGDGQLTVNALVRYSIAQSLITPDNMPDIVNRLEDVIKKEKKPHISALLNYFEAIVYKSYYNRYGWGNNRTNPEEEMPTDVGEWSQEQFNHKILELVGKSIADLDALKQMPVTDLSGILRYNDLGVTYVPTMLEFMSMKSLELINDIYGAKSLESVIKDKWLTATEGNTPAHIFALVTTGGSFSLEDYNKYKDSPYSAQILTRIYISDLKERYEIYKDYVKRFPDSPFTPEVKNMITDLESMSVRLSYPETLSPHDSVPIQITVSNATSFNIRVYRLTESAFESYRRLNWDEITVVNEIPVTVPETVPFNHYQMTKVLPPLPYGIYAIGAAGLSFGGKPTGESDIYQNNILRVTDMAMFCIARLDDKSKIGVVDINTGKPVANATVNYTTGTLGKTNINGLVRVPYYYEDPVQKTRHPFSEMLMRVVKGEDQYSPALRYYTMTGPNYSDISSNIFTDLGVYRPGETLQWAAATFFLNNSGMHPLAQTTMKMVFKDQNGKGIDTLTLDTDEYGRIQGSFVIPKDRMNGRFVLTLYRIQYDGRLIHIGTKAVNVSEYKTPTFAVTFPDERYNYVNGQPVKISGKVETYSGMPVANTEVRLSLIQSSWVWWGWRNNNGTHLMDTTVKTDGQGVFTFSYQPDLFSENKSRHPWSMYRYKVVATATTDAGETQEETKYFIVGKRRGIELGEYNNNVYLNDKPIKLPLKYNTTDEEHPSTMCSWEIKTTDSKKSVKTGTLDTADPTIDLTDLPSGTYSLRVRILDAQEGEEDVEADISITIFRKTDTEPPVKDCPLWVSPLEERVDNTNTAHMTIGVSVPKAYIYYVAATTDEVIADGWLTYTRGIHDLAIPMPKQPGANVTVWFNSYYDKKTWNENKQITNPYKREAVIIQATSFRDKLAPGDIEHWTFSLTDQNGKPHRGVMLLDMFDKAIASISSNDWSWRNWHNKYLAANLGSLWLGGENDTYATVTGNMLNIDDRHQAVLPFLYTFNKSPFNARNYPERVYALGRGGDRPMMREKGAVEAAEEDMVLAADMTKSIMLDDVSDVRDVEGDPKVDEKNLDKVILRESDVKTALWQPMLTSDDKGNIQLEFEVPNFNTTWITQAVAWDEKMVGSTWMAEVLTQKPIMVRSSMPRFLRQGDVAQLAATVQNATDAAATCDAVIELFDPQTGDIYSHRNFNLTLEPMGSQAVKIDWTVPDTISFVGFRIKAANGRYGDGEQVMVPVLTTISPVIETEPFYLEAAQAHYEAPLPQFPADARVTLEYCDNPTWYCALALPTIFNDSYHTSSQAANSLFALQVAQVVAKSQPEIKEAITHWKQHNEDSVLVSLLERNQDLKIGTLLASPWVRDADQQTLRMSRLHELFDDAIAKRHYEKIISTLQDLQMADGGFTWFRYPDCKSDFWTTNHVLELIGEIKQMGGMPDDVRLSSMVRRALMYCDNESVRLLNEGTRYRKYTHADFTTYAYTRSLFPEVEQPKATAKLLKNTLKYMNKRWKDGLSLSTKAWYAITLDRNGYHKTALNIVESIRQFAIVKPSTGMYWDNLTRDYGWWEFDKVAYTCTILRALNEIDPRSDELDQVRKWMLLMKQSNDWGSGSLAADAVYSILTTGSQWLGRNALPAISIAGQPVNLDGMEHWLGYLRTTVPASTTGDITIDRSGNGPAWGSIYCQYKAPMTQVQEKSIEDISISKEYYVYSKDGKLHQATSFKVGDKVKVRVVIKLNKDMDYVTLTDERAACFEPVDKLSGYRYEDKTGFYLETKDTQSNMFFNMLNKGTHIIGYDVWVTNPGEFTSGIATIQCQYAPQLSAHSAGKTISITNQ